MKMGKRPWMPFFYADFFAAADGLSDADGMAYLRLIRSYWENGRLPDDELKLARIARMTPNRWTKARANIKEFFGENWSSERLDFELAKFSEISNQNRAKALQRHSNGKTAANPQQSHLHGHLQSNGMVGGSRARENHSEEVETLVLAFLKACGLRREKDAPNDWGDVRSRAARWLAIGYPTSMIVAETKATVARERCIKPLNYFEEVFATATRQAARPLPAPGVSDAQRF